MKDPRRSRGAEGEALVAAWYTERGDEVLERNWSCRGGELDLVVRSGETLVFVEVRSVTTAWLDSPLRTVDRAKQVRIARAAEAWLRRSRRVADTIRFDVVGVVTVGGVPTLEVVEDAFVPPWAF